MATLLYFIAKNPRVQDKLRLEVLGLLPNVNSKLTADGLDRLPYLRACLKESLRIQSVVPGIQRATGQNIVLNGYQIPKDVNSFFLKCIIGKSCAFLIISNYFHDRSIFFKTTK